MKSKGLFGKYITIGARGDGSKRRWRVIYLNTNEQVGIYKTKEEANKVKDRLNKEKANEAKR